MKNNIIYFLFTFIVSSCSEVIIDGQKGQYLPIQQIYEENAGTNCEYGGKKIAEGIDYNVDGKLDLSEMSSVRFVCDAAGEFKYLYVELEEPSGDNCEHAGKLIKGGLDVDRDGFLDAEEALDIEYYCNESPEYVVLVKFLDEPVGANCELGGIKRIQGKDLNKDDELEDQEVEEESYKCNKEEDFEALVLIVAIDKGAPECSLGGTKFVQGLDLNKNGELDDSEVKHSATTIDCLELEDFAELDRTEDINFASSECPLGGKRVFKGRDLNGNAYLDSDEVLSSTVSCKTGSDFNKLVVVKELSLKDPVCALGGKKTTSGLDYNYNGHLDDDEVDESATVHSCYTSSDYSLLSIESEEPMGSNCRYGGYKVEKGFDYNRDGILNTDEIDASLTSYSCLGHDDFNKLVIVSEEPFGSEDCALGGKRTDTGIDLNRDGVLDADEVESTVFACYSQDHFNLLNRISEEPSGSNCSWGGKKVEQGRDYNNNGSIDDNELDPKLTTYNCYAPDDFNLLVNVVDEPKGDNCSLGGSKVEKGRDYNSNGQLDAIEKDPSLTVYNCTQSLERSRLSLSSDNVSIGSTIVATVKLVDEMGIDINRSGLAVEFKLSGGSSTGEFGPVIDNGDGSYSSMFTAGLAGSPTNVTAIIEGKEISTDKPMLTVLKGGASYISIEDKPDGLGKVVGALDLNGAKSLSLYAVSRDKNGTFVANEAVNWSISKSIASLSSLAGTSTVLHPKAANGKVVISAQHDGLGTVSTGDVSVSWDGLLVSLGFDNDLFDRSGRGNNAVNYGASFVEGKIGEAMLFNGVLVPGKSYYPHLTVADKDELDLTSSGSLAAWIKIDRYTDYGGIIMKGNEFSFSDESYSLQFYNAGKNKAVLNVKTGKDNAVYTGNYPFGKPVNTDKWFYLVGTWDTSGMRIYVNGVLSSSNPVALSANISSGDVHIGSQIAGQAYPKNTDKSAFVGKIDEVTVWSRALTAEEINYFYNNGNGR